VDATGRPRVRHVKVRDVEVRDVQVLAGTSGCDLDRRLSATGFPSTCRRGKTLYAR
jgi:hypothetical protein